MPEVAQATITVTPVLEGAQRTLTEQMTSAADPAGTAAGKQISKSLGQGMTSAGSAMTKSLTVPIAAIGTASVAAWKEVDNGLDTIVQKTGASGDALDEMHGILNNITSTIPTDFATAGSAIGEVNTRFGLTGDALEDLSSRFVKFAALNGQDVSNSVDSVSKMLAAFGMNADEAGTMLDALNVVGQQTGVDVGTLSDTVAANAKQFQEMGLSAEEAAAFIGSTSMAGLDSSTAMMGMKTAMKSATEDGISLSDALSNFEGIMNSNASETEKLSAAYELFGTRAGGAIENAVSNGTISLTDFSSSLGSFEGSVDDTFAGTLDPMDEFTTTLNELKSAGAELVDAAGPALSGILGVATDMIKKLSDAWSGLSPEVQDTIIKIAGIAAVAGPILAIGGKVIGGLSTIGSGISGLVGNLGGLSGAAGAAAGPVGNAGGAFASMAGQALKMVAAAAALYITAQAISTLVDAAIRIADAGSGAQIALAAMAGGIIVLMGAAAALGGPLTAGAVGIGVFGAAMLGIGAGIDLACDGIAKVIDAVSGLTETIATNAEGINSVVSNVGETVGGVITTISEGIGIIVDAIGGAISGVLDSVSGIFDSIGNAALNAGTGFEKMAGAVQTLVGTGVITLGASLGATADGIGKITTAASKADSSKLVALTNSFNPLTAAVKTSQSQFTAWGTSTANTLRNVASQFASMNLAGSMHLAINRAISTASSGISQLHSMFANTVFSFNQSIAVPHFSMSGSFNAESGTVPTVSVSWYRTAAEYGALFTTPQIIGVGDAAQPEVLLGEKKLRELVGGGNRAPINVYVSGAENPEDWGRRIARQLNRELRTR